MCIEAEHENMVEESIEAEYEAMMDTIVETNAQRGYIHNG